MDPQPLRREVLEILRAGVSAVEPAAAVQRALERSELPELSKDRPVVLLAVGKAAAGMARGAVGVLGSRVVRGLVVTKDGHAAGAPPGLDVRETAHPEPDERSVAAGERLLELAAGAAGEELLLVLVSGGASALAEAPAPGVTLQEIRARTRWLLNSGAPITTINAERKRMSRLKAGGLARAAHARMLVLCISDVPGDDPAVIGSGPAFPDGREPPPHVIVASLRDALDAAHDMASVHGWAVQRLPERLAGEARHEHTRLLAALDSMNVKHKLVLAGGETVVKVTGPGRGGRNQELALAAAAALETRPHTVLASLGTDGTDGPTQAAGGIVDWTTACRARALGVDVRGALDRNDALSALEALDDLIVTGPTGTNVGDLAVVAEAWPGARK